MYVRIIRADVPPENFDQVLAATKDRNVPVVKQFPGFKAGYWAGDRNTGRVTTVVLFESEEGIRAADEAFEQMRQKLGDPFGARIASVENLEVFMSEAAL